MVGRARLGGRPQSSSEDMGASVRSALNTTSGIVISNLETSTTAADLDVRATKRPPYRVYGIYMDPFSAYVWRTLLFGFTHSPVCTFHVLAPTPVASSAQQFTFIQSSNQKGGECNSSGVDFPIWWAECNVNGWPNGIPNGIPNNVATRVLGIEAKDLWVCAQLFSTERGGI